MDYTQRLTIEGLHAICALRHIIPGMDEGVLSNDPMYGLQQLISSAEIEVAMREGELAAIAVMKANGDDIPGPAWRVPPAYTSKYDYYLHDCDVGDEYIKTAMRAQEQVSAETNEGLYANLSSRLRHM